MGLPFPTELHSFKSSEFLIVIIVIINLHHHYVIILLIGMVTQLKKPTIEIGRSFFPEK